MIPRRYGWSTPQTLLPLDPLVAHFVKGEKSANGVTTWNLWHIGDDDSQSRDYSPCMWYTDYRPKPAYYAVQKVLDQR